MTDNKITAARIEPPKRWGDRAVAYGTVDGKEVKLFSYFDDELYFSPDEFIGLTVDEVVNDLYRRKDIAYLRS